MAQVSWEGVAEFIQESYKFWGRVERGECLDIAFGGNAPDEVVDALDALGSRVFPNPEAAREFLTQQGVVAP